MDLLSKVADYQKEQVNQIIMNARTATKGATVFMGDSIVHGFDVKHYFNQDNIYNCGVDGATTDFLLHLFGDTVIDYTPSKLVILIGTNDLSDTWQVDKLESAFNVFKLLQILMIKLPKTKVVVVSALPIIEELKSTMCRSNNQLRLLMNEYKANVEECENAMFVDIFNEFLEDGQMKKEYTYDGLHLTKEGYDHLFELIKQYF